MRYLPPSLPRSVTRWSLVWGYCFALGCAPSQERISNLSSGHEMSVPPSDAGMRGATPSSSTRVSAAGTVGSAAVATTQPVQSGTGGAAAGTVASPTSTGGSGDAGRSGSGGMIPHAAMSMAGVSASTLGATPPMGWNSWNTFGCKMDETLIQQMADTMVLSGMQAAGYTYVNVDDCWMDGRDAKGALRWNAKKFPSGIPTLTEYVHRKGLKLGIYQTPNTLTCVGLYGGIDHSVAVGSLGHETQDAQTFAAWGVDYLKYDLCQGRREGFAAMRDALRATGRPIFYSINPGNGQNDLCPPDKCSLELSSLANMWRIGFDIGPNWQSVVRLIDENAHLAAYAGPGHWNDPDMLEVGNGLNDSEGRAHFSLWAIMAAPLIAGNDLRSMSDATKAILTNVEVIAIDQDPLGAQGRIVATPNQNVQIWSKALVDPESRAVAVFNRGSTASAAVTISWESLGLARGSAMVRDLWAHSDLGTFEGSFTTTAVPGHGVMMFKITSAP